jgi:hypothetical protein
MAQSHPLLQKFLVKMEIGIELQIGVWSIALTIWQGTTM